MVVFYPENRWFSTAVGTRSSLCPGNRRPLCFRRSRAARRSLKRSDMFAVLDFELKMYRVFHYLAEHGWVDFDLNIPNLSQQPKPKSRN